MTIKIGNLTVVRKVRKMIEIESSGPWPENSLDDVNKLRIKILETSLQLDHDLCKHVGLYVSTPELDTKLNIPTLYLAGTISKSLDYGLGNTETTYRKFIENNDLAKIIEKENMQSGSAVMMFGHIIAIIEDIEISGDKACDYCDGHISLHREAVKLKDGRLICDDCYARVFDSVLHGCKGSMKDE